MFNTEGVEQLILPLDASLSNITCECIDKEKITRIENGIEFFEKYLLKYFMFNPPRRVGNDCCYTLIPWVSPTAIQI